MKSLSHYTARQMTEKANKIHEQNPPKLLIKDKTAANHQSNTTLPSKI
jgi:hypothetical protein